MFCIPSGTTAKIKYIFSMKILYKLVLVCFEIYGYCSGDKFLCVLIVIS